MGDSLVCGSNVIQKCGTGKCKEQESCKAYCQP
jgi:hypothetical protein